MAMAHQRFFVILDKKDGGSFFVMLRCSCKLYAHEGTAGKESPAPAVAEKILAA